MGTTPTSLVPLTGLSGPLLCWNVSGNKEKNRADDTLSDDSGLQAGLCFYQQVITNAQGAGQSPRSSGGM